MTANVTKSRLGPSGAMLLFRERWDNAIAFPMMKCAMFPRAFNIPSDVPGSKARNSRATNQSNANDWDEWRDNDWPNWPTDGRNQFTDEDW